MVFNILRAAVLGLAGWAVYRSFEAAQQQCSESEGNESEGAESAGSEADAASAEPAPAKASAKASAETSDSEPAAGPPQDLGKVRGIGPAIARLLNSHGITTWAQLAATETSKLQAILDEAGPRYRVHDPSTWPDQAAELAAAN